MILHGIEYQRPTSLNMRILADHVTYSFLAFMKSIFHFCLGCYCGGYSQNGRSNLSSWSRAHFMENFFIIFPNHGKFIHSYPSCNEIIVMKFCTWRKIFTVIHIWSSMNDWKSKSKSKKILFIVVHCKTNNISTKRSLVPDFQYINE